MQLEAVNDPILYRLRSGEEVVLKPGVATELPDQAAKQLLQKAPGKVRKVNQATTVEVGQTIAWEGADLVIRSGIVDFLYADADTIWAFVTLNEGSWAAVNTRYLLTENERA